LRGIIKIIEITTGCVGMKKDSGTIWSGGRDSLLSLGCLMRCL
jgi:hypothetical protein